MKRHGIMGALLLASATFMTVGALYAQDTTTNPNGTQQSQDVLRQRAAPPGCVPSTNGGTVPNQPGVMCPGPSPTAPVVPLPQAPGGTPGMPGDPNVRPPASTPAPGTQPAAQPTPPAVTPGQPTPGTVTPGTGMAPPR